MVTVIFVVCLGIVFTALQRIDNCHKRTLSPRALFGQDSEEVFVGYRGMCACVFVHNFAKCFAYKCVKVLCDYSCGRTGCSLFRSERSSATFDIEVTFVDTSACFYHLSQTTSLLFVTVEDHHPHRSLWVCSIDVQRSPGAGAPLRLSERRSFNSGGNGSRLPANWFLC